MKDGVREEAGYVGASVWRSEIHRRASAMADRVNEQAVDLRTDLHADGRWVAVRVWGTPN